MINMSRIGHTSLVYDGVRLSDYFVVRTIEMPLLPTIDASIIEVSGKPGAWFSNRKIGTRDINIGFGILSRSKKFEDILSIWIDLSKKLSKDKVCKLELGNGYYCNAILMGDSGITNNGNWSIITVTFRCFDPYIYRNTHTKTLKAGDNVFEVEGQEEALPVFKVKDATSITITNKGTGDKIKVDSIPSNQELVVDMINNKCTVNGVYKAADPGVSDFWGISPGTCTINLSGGSGTMEYTEVYL